MAATAVVAVNTHRESSMEVKPTALASSALYIFWTAAMVVIVAELGCLARTALLTMRYGRPWVVFAGTMAGTAVTMAVAVLFGNLFHERVPEWVVRWVSGAFFVVLGFLIASGKLQG
jgi:putative Ca2+/H+ antiporter (TMEM165/GDT1 family)